MTKNQERAYLLATAIVSREIAPDQISDSDWALLLLAAELHNSLSLPLIVANRVLHNHQDARGYFQPRSVQSARRLDFTQTMATVMPI